MTSRYLQLCIDRWISIISFVTTFISYWRNTCTYEAGKNPVFPLLLPYKNKEKKYNFGFKFKSVNKSCFTLFDSLTSTNKPQAKERDWKADSH